MIDSKSFDQQDDDAPNVDAAAALYAPLQPESPEQRAISFMQRLREHIFKAEGLLGWRFPSRFESKEDALAFGQSMATQFHREHPLGETLNDVPPVIFDLIRFPAGPKRDDAFDGKEVMEWRMEFHPTAPVPVHSPYALRPPVPELPVTRYFFNRGFFSMPLDGEALSGEYRFVPSAEPITTQPSKIPVTQHELNFVYEVGRLFKRDIWLNGPQPILKNEREFTAALHGLIDSYFGPQPYIQIPRSGLKSTTLAGMEIIIPHEWGIGLGNIESFYLLRENNSSGSLVNYNVMRSPGGFVRD